MSLGVPPASSASPHRHASRVASMFAQSALLVSEWDVPSCQPRVSHWDKLGESDGIPLYKHAVPDHPMGRLGGAITFEGVTPAEVLATIREERVRQHWDELYDHTDLLETLSHDAILVHTHLKGRFPAGPRDLALVVALQVNHNDGGSLYYVAGSVTEDLIPETKTHTRAHTDIAMWYLKPLAPSADGQPRTFVLYVSQTNPSGWIPSSLLALAAKEVPKSVVYVHRFIKAGGPSPQVNALAGRVNTQTVFDPATNEYSLEYTSAPVNKVTPTTKIRFSGRRYASKSLAFTLKPAEGVLAEWIAPDTLQLTDKAQSGSGTISIAVKPSAASSAAGPTVTVNGVPIVLAAVTAAPVTVDPFVSALEDNEEEEKEEDKQQEDEAQQEEDDVVAQPQVGASLGVHQLQQHLASLEGNLVKLESELTELSKTQAKAPSSVLADPYIWVAAAVAILGILSVGA